MMNAADNADTDVTFSDMNFSDQKLVGRSESIPGKRNGFWITKKKVVIVVLLVLILCLIIGFSVHYAKRSCDDNQTLQQTLTTPPTQEPVTSPKPNVTYSIRLPGSIIPIHYDAQIRPEIYGGHPEDFKFNGSVTITLQIKSATSDIILHSNKLEIKKDSIKLKSEEDDDVSLDLEGIELIPSPYEFLKIPVKSSLMAGKTYQLTIEFTGKILNDLTGIYYSSYVDKDGKTVYLLTSQLQATDARKVFPCFDEPALKATFSVSIDHQASLNTKSNTVINRTETLPGGWLRDVYEPTPIMSSYLLAFVVSDFTCKHTTTTTGTMIEVCARPTAASQTQYALSIAADIQEWFEQYHNISYPLGKMSHVAVPDFSAGAMENWGLVLYRETALLYDAVTAPSAYAMQRVALVVAHELAHQWFGNLVTTAWWDDIWLNEGFASFMELLGVHNVKDYSSWDMEAQVVSQYQQKVMVDDSLVSSHPVYQAVGDPADVNSMFDSITYDKGMSVIRMMKYFLGEDTFRWGLSDYLKAKKFEASNHTDLFTSLTQRAKNDGKSFDVTSIMEKWIKQEGYPVVDLTFSHGDTSIELKQTRFFLDPNVTKYLEKDKRDVLWMVPVSYMSDKTGHIDTENLTVTWLTEATASIGDIAMDTQWVVGNVEQTFYYRVNYNIENWEALVQVLQNNHQLIPASSRSQLIDDSFMLGRSGLVDQTLALNLTLYLQREEEYPPWYSVHSNMRYMEKMLYQVDGDRLLQRYIQDKVEALYNKFSVDDGSENLSHIQRRLQALLWTIACKFELESCLQNATNQFQSWMQAVESNTSYSINPDYAPLVYCYGIAQGGVREWDFAHKMYKLSNSGSQKDSLLTALGCSKTPWILQRYLKWALDEDSHGFSRQDMRRILGGVSSRPLGNHIAWGFFKANWDVFFDRFGESSFSFSWMVARVTDRFCTEWEAQDFEEFFRANPRHGSARQQVKLSREGLFANIEWRKLHEQNVMNWLQEHV